MKRSSTGGTVFWKKCECNFQNSSDFRDPLLLARRAGSVFTEILFNFHWPTQASSLSYYLMTLFFLLFMLNRQCWIFLWTSEKTPVLMYTSVQGILAQKMHQFFLVNFCECLRSNPQSLQIENSCPELLNSLVIVYIIIIAFYLCS